VDLTWLLVIFHYVIAVLLLRQLRLRWWWIVLAVFGLFVIELVSLWSALVWGLTFISWSIGGFV
jgi:hypothetical protein